MRICTRILLMIIVSTILLTLFTGGSCDSGAESTEDVSIIGTWRLVRVIMRSTPVGDLTLTADVFLQLSGTGATTSTLHFYEDGTALLITTYEDESEDEVPGTWSINGDRIAINGAGIDDTVPFHIDGDTLTLTITMPIDFDSDGVAEDTEIDMVYDSV